MSRHRRITVRQKRSLARLSVLAIAAPAVVFALSPASSATGPEMTPIPAVDSATANPKTAITLRSQTPGEARVVTVRGARSGAHSGRLTTLPDGRGVTFTPDKAFTPGEKVTVDTDVPVVGANKTATSYTFTVSTPA